jgi:RND superfamily putative drug exporter
MLVVEEDGIASRLGELAALEGGLAEQDGMAGVIGPGTQRLPGGSGVLLAPNGDAARYALALDGDPDGARASATLSSVEERLPALLERSGLPTARTGVTGDTTIATELTEDTWAAFERVAPAAVAVLLGYGQLAFFVPVASAILLPWEPITTSS